MASLAIKQLRSLSPQCRADRHYAFYVHNGAVAVVRVVLFALALLEWDWPDVARKFEVIALNGS